MTQVLVFANGLAHIPFVNNHPNNQITRETGSRMRNTHGGSWVCLRQRVLGEVRSGRLRQTSGRAVRGSNPNAKVGMAKNSNANVASKFPKCKRSDENYHTEQERFSTLTS
jgi:hypothetical protein